MEEQAVEQVDQPSTPTLETPAEVAQGGSGNDFLNQLPEELRSHPSLSPIKDVGNLAKSYVNAQQLIGADKLAAPKNPSEEQLTKIHQYLGVPETADKYDVVVDGNIVTEEIASNFKGIAHKLNLTPNQVNGVMEYYKSTVNTSQEEISRQQESLKEETINNLKKEWGQAYEDKLAGVKGLLGKFGDSDIYELQLASGLKFGDDPRVIKYFSQMADFVNQSTSEDTIADATQTRKLTPNEAQAEIDAIMNSPEYTDKKNYVARQRAISRVSELMEMVHG